MSFLTSFPLAFYFFKDAEYCNSYKCMFSIIHDGLNIVPHKEWAWGLKNILWLKTIKTNFTPFFVDHVIVICTNYLPIPFFQNSLSSLYWSLAPSWISICTLEQLHMVLLCNMVQYSTEDGLRFWCTGTIWYFHPRKNILYTVVPKTIVKVG